METKCISEIEIGIDEAGRGTLIGRVYAGAVILNHNIMIPTKLIKDSKKLSSKNRAKSLEWIKENVKAWGVGFAEPEEIDKINILNATKLAMDRAILDLKQKNPDVNPTQLIIDGTGWNKKFPDYNVMSIVKGDSKYYSIAAASIIAKEYHDEHIKELCSNMSELNDKYGLYKNMGYATKKHRDGIELHGNSKFHRKSFKPCCKNIE